MLSPKSKLPLKTAVITLPLILVFNLFVTLAQSYEQSVARVIVFYSPTCRHCIEVIDNILPPLQDTYGDQVEIQLLNLTDPLSYQVYLALHESQPHLPNGVPQLYIDQYVLVGTLEIAENLPIMINECLAKGGCDWSFRFDFPVETLPTESVIETEPVYLAYCFDPSCLDCDQITYDLNYLQMQYPNLVVHRFNVRDDAAMIEAMCEQYGVPAEQRLMVPAVFIGENYLIGEGLTTPRIRALIENERGIGNPPPWEGLDAGAVELATSSIKERFGNFSVLAVAAAGLLDGINPCAFTTIIFFISYLALVGRGKREILLVGAAFTLAVFLTYLLMGLGLSVIIDRVGSVAAVGRVIYSGTALVCLALAALSLWDYVKVRQGRVSDIALQLPSVLKKRIHETIRTHSRMRGYVVAAFGAGILVSVFELACTGQVYLPTIVFMTSIAEMRLSAIAYLVLYNALFVFPLMIVFGMAYFGASNQRLIAVFQANVGAVKLFTALLFGVLGVWLIYLLLA